MGIYAVQATNYLHTMRLSRKAPLSILDRVREGIEFWRAVEMFSLPSIARANRGVNVFNVWPGEPLPWESGHPVRRAKVEQQQVWRHTVYAGVFPREAVFRRLETVFKPDGYEEPPADDSALFAFSVSDEGFLLEGSVVLASCVWAMVRTFEPGHDSPEWLSGFDRAQRDFRARIEETYIPHDERGRPRRVKLDWDAISDCLDRARETLGIAEDFPAKGIRISSKRASRKRPDEADHDFVNGLYADDLDRVSGAIGDGKVEAALRQYLGASPELDLARRVDVRSELEEVLRATGPDRIPLGRWPANPDRPLGLGQQLAVNEAMGMALRPTGDRVFAVNGPAGTGKTTMLRDLIAALVTERAARLAALAEPGDAFLDDPPYRWQGDRARTVRRLRPGLTGFEMVVASSNNAAVENVTVEIPSSAAIDDFWKGSALDQEDLRTLAGLATREKEDAGRGSQLSGEEETAWAVIAARLGRSSHRRAFVDNVWWTEKRDKDEKARQPRPPGLRDLLVKWSQDPDPEAWPVAVEAFNRARERATSIRDDRIEVEAALDEFRELKPRLDRALTVEVVARERAMASRLRRDRLAEESRRYEDEGRRLAAERQGDRRPFFLNFPARAAWRARDRQYVADIVAAEERRSRAAADLRPLEAEVDAWDEARAATEPLAAEAEKLQQLPSAYCERPGAVLPDDEWLESRELRERRAPWSDVEWNEARTELFLAALDLHRAFLAGAAHVMCDALDGTIELIKGVAPASLGGDAALAAWQALFLVVPVVSTTFASLGRLFGRLGPESFGWLLIDEAGQATPQSAVGGLWRSRRAVVVGDPLQLEPITTVPPLLEQAIRKHFGVAEEWMTGTSSVQSRADCLNRFGTTVAADGESIWVGAPLTVHRRCDHPMFDLCNEIVYGGLMIDATDRERIAEFEAKFPGLPQSTWIDVDSEVSDGNWVPAQGEGFDRVLKQLNESGLYSSRVIAISPFRDVATQLRARQKGNPGLKAGTIHTAQGMEADIVILVLGSDPERPKAREWAASKPNLLNVAVSRARHRLYVIGDRNRWRQLRYFDRLASGLPHDRPRG